MTISRIVERLVEENAIIEEAMTHGIISYAGLAEHLKPRIDKELKKDVQLAAIIMALRRLSEKLEKKQIDNPKFEKHTDLIIKSDLFEVTIKKSNATFRIVQKIYDSIDHDKDFLTVTQGVTQVNIISNKRNKKIINELVKKERIIKTIDNLASISVSLPSKAPEQPGYFFLITRALAWENLSIVELVSTLTETNIILKEQDIPKAFSVLKQLITKNT